MEKNFHIQLLKYEIKAINFVKQKDFDNDFNSKVDPQYKVMIEKTETNEKEGLLLVTINNDYFKLKLISAGIFKDDKNANIDSHTLSKVVLPLLLPFSRTVIFNTLRDAGFYNILLPTIDVQRSISSDD